MSWNIIAIGKSSKVAEKVKQELDNIKYLTGIEQEIKDLLAPAILKTIENCKGTAVKVTCNGSGNISMQIQQINIIIEPVYGFIE